MSYGDPDPDCKSCRSAHRARGSGSRRALVSVAGVKAACSALLLAGGVATFVHTAAVAVDNGSGSLLATNAAAAEPSYCYGPAGELDGASLPDECRVLAASSPVALALDNNGFESLLQEPESTPVEGGFTALDRAWTTDPAGPQTFNRDYGLSSLEMSLDYDAREGAALQDRGDEWTRNLIIGGQVTYADLFSMSVDGYLRDMRKVSTARFGGPLRGQVIGFAENTISDTNVELGILGDRLTLQIHHGASDYHAEDDDRGDTAHAFTQRAEARLFQTGDLGVSTFVEYSYVDENYITELGSKKSQDKIEDEFGPLDTDRVQFGSIISVGLLTVTLMQSDSKSGLRDDDPVLGQSQSIETNFRLAPIGRLVGAEIGTIAAALVPDAVWYKIGKGTVDVGGDIAQPVDRTIDVSYGTSWSWNSGYVSLSRWESVYDTRQQWAEDSDWLGRGVDVSFGHYLDQWSLDVSASTSRGDNLDPWSRSVDYDTIGNVSLSIYMDNLPTFTGSYYAGRTRSEYLAYEGSYLTDYWGLDATIDFSKFAWQLADINGRRMPWRLKTFYELKGERTVDGFTEKESRQNDHVFGVTARVSF